MYDIVVSQRDQFGCGVACVAYLCKKSYDDAKTFFNSDRIHEYGCDCIDIVNALARCGFNYAYKQYAGEYMYIPDRSIVFVGPSKIYRVGHYLVKCNDSTWMNPWIYGENVTEAQAGYQHNLLEDNIEWVIYHLS